MNERKKVLVVGLGLIGGSLALCIKKEHPEVTIIGFNRSRINAEHGKKLGIIDEIAETFAEGAKIADVIIFCTPVKVTEKMFQELLDLPLKDNVILTDAGSTKSEIMEMAQPLLEKGLVFIGGHPMAGSHKSGVLASDVNLFENAYYLLTPDRKEHQKQVKILQELLKGTHSKFLILSPEDHDKITGMLSHLPHIIASGIVNQTDTIMQRYPEAKRLAAGGFRDITRIASSDPVMWTDILLSNDKILLELLDKWQMEMSNVKQWLLDQNREAIYQFFYEAKETRDGLPIHKEGAIPAFHDLFVDVPDYPGVIAEITGYLAEEEISVINLKILETREDIYGILQLTFKNQKELQRAQACIEKNSDYLCYEK